MNEETIKQKIKNEGFDTNVKDDWYIWITIFKLGMKSICHCDHSVNEQCDICKK